MVTSGKNPLLFLLVQILFCASAFSKSAIQSTDSLQKTLLKTPSGNEVCWVFDLDDTLFTRKGREFFGSARWHRLIVTDFHDLGFNNQYAKSFFMPIWLNIQSSIEMEATEASLPDILNQAQGKGTRILGLTARSPIEANITLKQLMSLNYEFVNTPLAPLDLPAGTFTNNIGFTDWEAHKGQSLLYLLNTHLGLVNRCRQVYFFDDLQKNCGTIAGTFEREDAFNVLATHYTPPRTWEDNKPNLKEMAAYQLKAYIETGVIVSDEQAQKAIFPRG